MAEAPATEPPTTEPPAVEDAPAEAPEQDAVSESIQTIFNSLWVPQSRYTNGPHLRAVFRTVVADVREATVEVRSGKRRIAYGGIVGPDGWVITKGLAAGDNVIVDGMARIFFPGAPVQLAQAAPAGAPGSNAAKQAPAK